MRAHTHRTREMRSADGVCACANFHGKIQCVSLCVPRVRHKHTHRERDAVVVLWRVCVHFPLEFCVCGCTIHTNTTALHFPVMRRLCRASSSSRCRRTDGEAQSVFVRVMCATRYGFHLIWHRVTQKYARYQW